jgi:glycosyltransferase involved in cell wall biosynthesis
MKPLKICHITVGHSPLDDRIFYKECSSLAKIYNDVTIIAPNDIQLEPKNRVKFVTFPKLGLFSNLKTAYKKAVEVDADIYHIHEFELLPYALMLKFKYGKKIIHDAHETIYYYFTEFSRRSRFLTVPVGAIAQAIEWFCSIFVDQVITVTPWVAKGFKPFNKNLDLIYNYPLLAHFNMDKNVEKTETPLILYPGQISTARNIDIMVKSMLFVKQKFPKAKLLLLGNTTPWFKDDLDRVLNENNLHDVVEIKAPIPYSEIPDLMKSATIGLASMAPNESFKRSIQIKPFEFMCAGIPVVAARVPSTEIYVEKSNAGVLIDDPTPESIADGIMKLLSNPDLISEMGINGKRAVTENFNWSKEEIKLYNIYQKVIES